MSKAQPAALLRAELKHAKELNAELVAHLRFAVKLLGAFPAMNGTAQVDAMRAVIAKAQP